jgi:hypothetical protein
MLRRLCSRLVLSLALLGVILLVLATVWMRSGGVNVPPPHGVDDTRTVPHVHFLFG